MAPSAPPIAPRRHAPASERRAQILLAALRCVGEKGYHAATMDDLVRASGLSKGSLYWHFRSKEDVFLALFDAFSAELFADWEGLESPDANTLDVVRGVGERAIARLSRDLSDEPLAMRAWMEFFTHPQARARLNAVYRRSRAKLASGLSRDRARGTVRDLPPEAVASAIIALLEGLFLQALVDDAFDLAANWRPAFDVLTGGIAA